jgi:choline dehydrogenase
VIDLPGVGRGLVDHPAVGVFAKPRSDIPHLETVFAEIGARYSSGHELGSFNDMQLCPVISSNIPGLPDALVLAVGVYAPASVGCVEIDPLDPWARPLIWPNFLGEDADLERALDGLRRAWTVLHTEPLASAIERVFPLTAEMVADDDVLGGYARDTCSTFQQPVGTARMGPADDPMAVVGPACDVHSVDALRVVDASIMPVIPRANTNIPTIMLAEHAIDLTRKGASLGR